MFEPVVLTPQRKMESLEGVPATTQSVIVRGRGKNKKFWSVREEAVLLEILAELSASGWKTETGYKNGYCQYVEKLMEEKLPGSGFKADPHIESKIKALKRCLAYVLDIEENGKDFWWDDEQKMVLGNKDAFLAWAKNHEGASSLFMKPFSHYDKLCEIYGKKRNRKRVRTFSAATDADQSSPQGVNYGNEMQSNVREDAASVTAAQSTIAIPSENGNTKSKKSREFDPSETEFFELSKTIRNLAEAQKDLAMAVVNMKKASKHDVEISELRKKLFSVLLNLPGLSPTDVVKAARLIGQDDRKLEVFYSMPDDYKAMFARIEIVSSE